METLCNSKAVCVSAILAFAAILPFASARPSQARAANSAIEPLKFDLPPRRFRGTPPHLAKIPNLEPLRKTPKEKFVRLEIDYPRRNYTGESWHLQNYKGYDRQMTRPASPLVPVGTANVALGKKVSSSDPKPIIGNIDMLVDGVAEAWDGGMLEIGPGLQHVTVDLGAGHELSAIVLWHDHHRWRVYHDVIVQVAADPNFTNAVTLFNNDRDNSAELGKGGDREYLESNFGKLIDASGVVARYVRAWSNGCVANEFNHYVELAVYGRPVDAQTNRHGLYRKCPHAVQQRHRQLRRSRRRR